MAKRVTITKFAVPQMISEPLPHVARDAVWLNGRIFVATDAGVFMLDENGKWLNVVERVREQPADG